MANIEKNEQASSDVLRVGRPTAALANSKRTPMSIDDDLSPAGSLFRITLPEAINGNAQELARAVQEAATTELSKLRLQLTPLEMGDMHPVDEAECPPFPVAITAVGGSILKILDEARAEKQERSEGHPMKLEDQVMPSRRVILGLPLNSEKTEAIASTNEEASPRQGAPSKPSTSSVFLEVPSVTPSVASLPEGFDLNLSMRLGELCGYTYHSCDPPAKDGSPTHVDRLQADLATHGLRLVREIESKRLDTYALIARNDDEVYVIFRGSCTLKNLNVDLNYMPTDDTTIQEYASEAGMRLPSDLKVHSGFLEAWRTIREEVVDVIEEIIRSEEGALKESNGLRLVVSGHSMGGAIAMFASLELASRLRREPRSNPFRNGHVTYTFAAPRLGNAVFARLYNLAFPRRTDHWALQRSNDAIPHLPFAAWGYRHPNGVAYIDPPGEDVVPSPQRLADIAPEGAPESISSSGDRGDDAVMMRPFDGKMYNWASYHHIFAYLEPLQDLCVTSGECELDTFAA
jgi:predicted lipase